MLGHTLAQQVPDRKSFSPDAHLLIWEFPKIRGTLFWDPYNKEPTIEGVPY